MTITEALAAFEHGWVAAQPVTPRIAYERTLRMLAFWLQPAGRTRRRDAQADDLEAFVRWHAASGLVDDAEASRKVALHVARLGAYLAERATGLISRRPRPAPRSGLAAACRQGSAARGYRAGVRGVLRTRSLAHGARRVR